jgi:hypothetical protein
VVSGLATGPPKGCGFEPGQSNGFLKAIKIHSTPSCQMGSKARRSHVSPTGLDRPNSHFLRPSPTAPEVSGCQVRS